MGADNVSSWTQRTWYEPEMIDDDTMRLWGVGPDCSGCAGATHAVTADENAEQAWWCKKCNVRLDDEGNYGNQARFPAESEPDSHRSDQDV